MEDQDRVSLGWQPFLTPRQTRIIRDALVVYSPLDSELPHYDKLFEWFDHETGLHEPQA
jgi:hypothetical protein